MFRIILTFIMLSVSSYSHSDIKCSTYTDEQLSLLHLAYITGQPYDLGLTLAAIVKQESFVGNHVIRVNSKDGKYGSYGVSHINLETAMYFEGTTNSWEARANIAPKLMTDDMYSLELSLIKLNSVSHLSWKDQVRSYNGGVRDKRTLEYFNKIRGHINEFNRCNVFIF